MLFVFLLPDKQGGNQSIMLHTSCTRTSLSQIVQQLFMSSPQTSGTFQQVLGSYMLDSLPKNCNFRQKDSTEKFSNKKHGHFAKGFQLTHLDTNTSSKFKFLNLEWVLIRRTKETKCKDVKHTSRATFPISYINTTSFLYETNKTFPVTPEKPVARCVGQNRWSISNQLRLLQ
jgi:hypothetical protein